MPKTKKPKKAKAARVRSKATLNVKKICRSTTDLNISAQYVNELVFFLEDALIPAMIKISEKKSARDGRKTLMEQDFLVMRDYIWYYTSNIVKNYS